MLIIQKPLILLKRGYPGGHEGDLCHIYLQVLSSKRGKTEDKLRGRRVQTGILL